ncbi:TetR/AcrR family transcriptional regulator [Actinoplanes sp. DH11]|uniref:TetR/AcrR family transcriptional regulator n=1 Tax=Actinoplanes sp. DH11 TaxID=2857011 RepID=UPI001E4F73C6|nr:TetR/AcrR family transcriptional regulator [Actinoplanes sp. DH11]
MARSDSGTRPAESRDSEGRDAVSRDTEGRDTEGRDTEGRDTEGRDTKGRRAGSRRAESRPSEARSRLLETAIRIFYAEGIHAVGVDRIIAEATVTRATFYRHFPGKEDLVTTYLREVHRMDREAIDAIVAAVPEPVGALRSVADSIVRNIRSPGFRGCAFLNAAAEYPDSAHPVHQEIIAHRQWFLDTLTALIARVAEDSSDAAARHFVMLRDGAMAAGCLFDPDLVTETFLRGVDGLLRIHAQRGPGQPTDTSRPAGAAD